MTDKEREYLLRITCPKSIVDEFSDFENENSTGFKIKSTNDVSDKSIQKSGIGNVADIITLVQGAVLVGQFALFLYRLIKKHKLRYLVLKMPKGSAELCYSKTLTLEQIIEKLMEMLDKNCDNSSNA